MKEDIFLFTLIIVIALHCFLLRQNNKSFGINPCSSVLVSIITFYDLVPLLFFFGMKVNIYSAYQSFWEEIRYVEREQFFFAELVKLLFVFEFYLFYRYLMRYWNFSYCIEKKRLLFAVSFFAWTTLLIGGTSLLFYIKQFGDLATFFSYGEYIRSFQTENTDLIGRAVLLLVPARMIVVAPILFYCLAEHYGGKKYVITIALCISFALSIIFLIFNSGKAGIGSFCIIFFVTYIKKIIKHPWLLLFVSTISLFPILGFIDAAFMYLSTDIWVDPSSSSFEEIGQFSYVYANMVKLRNILNISGLRFGLDFITGVLNLIPGVTFQATYEFTSQSHFGLDWMFVGGVPIDYITFSYIQIGILGLPFCAFILGYVCFLLGKAIPYLSGEYDIIGITILICFFIYFVNSDIGVLLASQFQLTICSLCVLISFRRSNTSDSLNPILNN